MCSSWHRVWYGARRGLGVVRCCPSRGVMFLVYVNFVMGAFIVDYGKSLVLGCRILKSAL